MLSRYKQRYCIHILLGLLMFVSGANGQELELFGIGMSGRMSVLDTLVRPGDSLHFIVEFSGDSTWDYLGVISGEDQFNEVRFQYYTGTIPSGDPISTAFIPIDSTQFTLLPDTLFQRAVFSTLLPSPLNESIHSFQLVMGLYARTDADTIIQSEVYSSFIVVGESLPLENPVDSLHATYLEITHSRADEPEISDPESSDTTGRYIRIVYDQPFDADEATLTLKISEFDSPEPEEFLFYLNDPTEGLSKEIQLDALDLSSSQDIDSLIGDNSLVDGGRYNFQIGYRYAGGTPSDTGFVTNIYLDAHTDGLQLIEPDIGSESPDSTVYVFYNIVETADTVWLTFEADTLTPVPDLFSPHIFALIPQYNSNGLQSVSLDGTNIGTNSPLILASNRGVFDSLVTGTIYNVILSYGDRFGNDAVADTNYGYVWPEDIATIPASIQNPRFFTADNSTLRVDFTLPEPPLTGTVKIYLQALPSQPGSPHTLWLGGLGTGGPTGLYLNGTFLSSSDMVTQVEGGNALVDGAQYLVRVLYQDSRDNPEASSLISVFNYDNHTELPVIHLPVMNDTLSLLSSFLIYDQLEAAIPGSLQMIFTQTTGPDADPGAPHTLFLSDEFADTSKLLIFNPAFIAAGEGVDSVNSSGSLMPRAKYRMTIRYQDTLANPYAESYVDNLLFPSGSRVIARGESQTVGVFPNEEQVPAFYLGLRAEGPAILRGLRFRDEGNLSTSDLISAQTFLWASVDSFFDASLDIIVDTLDPWTGGDMKFDSFGVGLSEEETFFIVAVSFTANADFTRSVSLTLPGPDFVDCGNDPVDGFWPIGGADMALPVEFTSFYTEQDSVFGSLKVIWLVESEWNNAGFVLHRRLETEDEFVQAGSFTEFGELYGRGTDPTAFRYTFVDRGLEPGATYVYRVESVSLDGFTTHLYENEATGTPRVPPDNFELRGAYPNPFNQIVTIEYVVPNVADVTIFIYDILGRQVRELVRAQLAAAVYRTTWDGKNDAEVSAPSGVYIYRMTGGKFYSAANKMLLVR